MVNKFPHHAVPLALVILSSVFAIGHQFYLIGEAQNVGKLFEQVQAVALKAVIAIQRLIGFLVHHIGVFLNYNTYFSISFINTFCFYLYLVSHCSCLCTRIVVTMRVLLAMESVTLVDNSLEFSVKLRPVFEFHTPICKRNNIKKKYNDSINQGSAAH